MQTLLSLISVILLVAGGVGLFITYTGTELMSVLWWQGTVTYGAFLIIGLAMLITFMTILFEGD